MKRICIEDLIQSDLGLTDSHIKQLAKISNSLYRRLFVNGRHVHAPAPELKMVQCWISDFLHEVWGDLPEYVSAYEPNRSIKQNALMHAKSAHIIKFDIKHFFDSCERDKVSNVFSAIQISFPPSEKSRNLTDGEIELLCNLACFKDKLCIGAPSSPAIANRILLRFDEELKTALGSSYVYSRYSDDITISSKDWINKREITQIVQDLLNSYGFELNESKTNCVGRGNRRIITGVFLNPDGTLSVGKKHKKKIKHELYQFLMYKRGHRNHILGLINFAAFIDPKWTSELIMKYNNYGLAKKIGVINALKIQ